MLDDYRVCNLRTHVQLEQIWGGHLQHSFLLQDWRRCSSGNWFLIIRLLGRKKAVIVTFAVLSGLFFLSVLSFGVRITETWDLDHVVCLFAAPVIGSVWDSVSLLSKELSPTSHQGMIYCLCSASARVSAFAGPYLILLYDVVDPRVVLSIFGGLTALSSFVASFNSDSTHKPIPLAPDQLVSLHLVGKKLRMKL